MNEKHLSVQKKPTLDMDSSRPLQTVYAAFFRGKSRLATLCAYALRVVGDHSAETFQPLWEIVGKWKCYFYITDGWKVYPNFIPDGDQIICKTYMTSDPAEVSLAKERASVDQS